MFVRLRKSPHFTGEVYHTQFIDGVSQEHISSELFTRIAGQLGLEPEWIPDPPCQNCIALQKRITELEDKLSKKAKK